MFNRFSQILGVVILGLCVWSWGQSQRIDSLKAENQMQAQAIIQQRTANAALTEQLIREREAVEVQQQMVLTLHKQSEVQRAQLKSHLQTEPCAAVDLPSSVRDGIKQLHKPGHGD